MAQNTPDAPEPLAGLNPADLLRQGAAADTQTVAGDGSGKRTAFAPPAIDELQKIFPQFEILELVGRGGMGAVYKVRQRALDRICALKILPAEISGDPAFAGQFAREAKALAQLNHPGIVTLYEFGQTGGLCFILMEYVDGANLRRLIDAGRIAPREALAIVPQICDALQYAHDRKIIHRDIKPENILLDRQGRVKVADFGLAKLLAGDTAAHETIMQAGKVMGTPAYMAPEQRETPTAVDHRADIYALGVVFYQMLTGELPGKPLEAPSRKVQLDVRLDEVVLRALEKTPERRYPQASAMKTKVEQAVTGNISAGTSSLAEFLTSKNLLLMLFAAMTASVLTGAICVILGLRHPLLSAIFAFITVPCAFVFRRLFRSRMQMPERRYLQASGAAGNATQSAKYSGNSALKIITGIIAGMFALFLASFALFGNWNAARKAIVAPVTPKEMSAGNTIQAHEEKQTAEALAWLAQIDAGKYAESYAASAEFAKKLVSESDWKTSVSSARGMFGELISRKLQAVQNEKNLPGAPDGEYRVLTFTTEFSGKKNAVETLIFAKEKDGTWKPAGYFIR